MGGGVAARAVDGNTNGRYGGKSCTHTRRQRRAWWQVDLGKVRSVKRVVLYNRVDCCRSRLNHVNVLVDNSLCGSIGHWGRIRSKAVNCGCKRGRRVKVQLKGTNYLTL